MDLTRWSWDPAVVLGVWLAAVLYARGWLRLRRHERKHAACFGAGLALVLVALCSPVGANDGQSFSLHMTEHLLLALGAAPLLLLGRPIVPLMLGLPAQDRRGVARVCRPFARLGEAMVDPRVALSLYLTAFAIWHLPVLYDLAQGETPIHYLEHATFFVTAVAFWWPLLAVHPHGGRRRLPKIASVLYVAPPMLESTLIGALFTFAARPLYATYSSVEDQQLAGLIMWIPGGLVYAAAVLASLMSVLRDEAAQADVAPIARDDTVLLESAQSTRYGFAATADAPRQPSVR